MIAKSDNFFVKLVLPNPGQLSLEHYTIQHLLLWYADKPPERTNDGSLSWRECTLPQSAGEECVEKENREGWNDLRSMYYIED